MHSSAPWGVYVALATLLPGPIPLAARQAPSLPPTLDATGALSDFAFLAGCWSGTMGPLDMREQWTAPEGDVMLWTTRFYRDGVLADFEFGMLVVDEGVPTLWPYPRGERSEHGFPLVSSGDELVFENLAHDFPVRIIYARLGESRLAPRIEGRDGRSTGWSLSRVACPDGGGSPGGQR